MTLYEILVPTIHGKTGKPIRLRYHRVWDAKVREISGGLSIMKPLKGQWVAPDQALFCERMIPVRIGCTRSQMEKIADMTAAYYAQQAIMYYVVSTELVIRHYPEEKPLGLAFQKRLGDLVDDAYRRLKP